MADTTVHKYLVYQRPEQRALVDKLQLRTLRDLFAAALHASHDVPLAQPGRLVVYKGQLLNFLNGQCRGAFLDLGAMRRAQAVVLSGQYPKQVVSLVVGAPVAPPPRSLVGRPPAHVVVNGGLCEEAALAKAMEESVRLVKPAPPTDLCCPITLELFRDPVDTIHGMTYERSAIEAWLKEHRTDPMTNETLRVTFVWPNDAVRRRVQEFLK